MNISTLMSRRLSWSAVGASAVVILVLAGCGSGPASSGTPPSLASGAASGSPAASAPAASAEATPDVTSTTVPGASPPAGSISVVFAGPPPHFEPKTLSATAGDLSFVLQNDSHATHNLAIGPTLHRSLATSHAVGIGGNVVFSVRGLPAGSYVIWCTIDNHAAEGMVGTLTVH